MGRKLQCIEWEVETGTYSSRSRMSPKQVQFPKMPGPPSKPCPSQGFRIPSNPVPELFRSKKSRIVSGMVPFGFRMPPPPMFSVMFWMMFVTLLTMSRTVSFKKPMREELEVTNPLPVQFPRSPDPPNKPLHLGKKTVCECELHEKKLSK